MDENQTRGAGRLQTVVRKSIGPVFRRVFDLTIVGLENVPTEGPAIIAANHTSVLDSFIVPAVLPRNISYVGKAEYLDDWKTKHIFPALGMIPIDRSGGDAAQEALDTAAKLLANGELFGIYPEGTRSRSGNLHKGRTGAARLAIRCNSPIIPVGHVGTLEIQPPDSVVMKPFKTCSVRFGRQMWAEEFGDPNDPRVLRLFTDAVMFEIAKLSGQTYVNTYAGAPTQPTAQTERKPAISVPKGRGIDLR